MRQWRMFSTDRSGAKTRCPETITSSAPMPCSEVHGTVWTVTNAVQKQKKRRACFTNREKNDTISKGKN
ncbi:MULTISPECIES: hypothetical protein [Clostridia]|uniref:hypothetical protein n=1 Tax=Clostridia TaxID=186801 RepID=UPI00067E73A7|nr:MULTISPECIES: hypothetical protein [Clostridia]